jgi:hypothetical protein
MIAGIPEYNMVLTSLCTLEGKNHLDDLGIGRRILKLDVTEWTGFIWLRIGPRGGLL